MTMPITIRVHGRVKTVRQALAYAGPKRRALPAGIEKALAMWEAADALPSSRRAGVQATAAHERAVCEELVATATPDTLAEELLRAEAKLRFADTADRMRQAGLLDLLATRADAAIDGALDELHARLAPAALAHATRLVEVARRLPQPDPFDPAAVLAANASDAFDIAREACTALLTIAAVFPARPGRVEAVPFNARPLVPLADVGTVVPQAYVSIGELDDLGNTAEEATHYLAVRQMHDDARDQGVNVALIRLAAGHYGPEVRISLAPPSEMLHRCEQHTNAQFRRRADQQRRSARPSHWVTV